MTMKKITIKETMKIADKYRLKPIKVKGTEVVNIRKRPSNKFVEISWEEFEKALKDKKLAVYKATESDFLKIMKG